MMQKQLFTAVDPYVEVVDMDAIRPPVEDGSKNATTKSIKVLGMVSALTLRDMGDGTYEIVDGRRRYSALLAQGAVAAPAIVIDENVSDAQLAAMSLALNTQRSSNPLDEAEHISRMMDAGFSVDDISRMLGLSPATVKKRARLVILDDRFKKAIRNGEIAIGTAENLANLDTEYQSKALDLLDKYGELKGSDISALRSTRVQEVVGAMDQALFDGDAKATKEDHENVFRIAVRNGFAAGLSMTRMKQVVAEEKK